MSQLEVSGQVQLPALSRISDHGRPRHVRHSAGGRAADRVRGAFYWADLGPARGSGPAKRRPVLVLQDDAYNTSRLATVLAAMVTSNTALAAMPGNTFLPAAATGLARDTVVNVTALVTLNESDLTELIGISPLGLIRDVDRGVRRILGL